MERKLEENVLIEGYSRQESLASTETNCPFSEVDSILTHTHTSLDNFTSAVLPDMENVIECGVKCSIRAAVTG